MFADEGRLGLAANLLHSVTNLGANLLAAAQTRVELLSTEVGEEVDRALQVVLWTVLTLLAGIFGLLMVGATVIIYFWDTHRMVAALSVTTVFLVLAAVAGLVLRSRLRSRVRLLDATRTELQRDVALLTSRR